MYFEDVVVAINPFGKYQKWIYFLIGTIGIPAALHVMSTIFLTATPDHRCAVPGLDNDTWASQGPWHDEMVKMTIPYDQEEGMYAECSYYAKRNFTNPFSPDNSTAKCSRWVYSRENFDETVITQLNVVCEDKEMVTLYNSILIGGLLGGSLILGSLSDIIGRKKTMMIGLFGQFGVTIATGFVTNFWAFVALRFFATFFSIGFFLAAFVAGMELVGPAQRTIAGIAIELFWTFGLFVILFLAYFIRDWKYLQTAVACGNLLFVGHIFLLPESARWLASKGRLEEASAIIRKAAKVNKADVPEKVLSLQDLQSDGPQEKVWQLFTSPRLLVRCLIIFLNWAVISMVYFGLGLNVESLSGNLYLNFLYASIAEGLSYVFCLIFLYKIGRRPLHSFSMLLGGVACILMVFPVLYGDKDDEWATTTLSMIGKFGISAAFAIIYVFSAELFPTVVRNSGMGACSIFARFGGIASPFIADLENYVSGDFGVILPSLVFGCLSVLAGSLALFLPETLNKKLPETVADAKNFGREPKRQKNAYRLDETGNPASGEKEDRFTKF